MLGLSVGAGLVWSIMHRIEAAIANNINNTAGVFILRRLHTDDNERVITTLWTEAHYI